jgi:branched-chain amino acid transport system substrate-binding protein
MEASTPIKVGVIAEQSGPLSFMGIANANVAQMVIEDINAAGGEIVEEDYYPLDHDDYTDAVEKIMSGGAEVVFNTTVPPGVVPFLGQLHEAGYDGQIVCTYFDENCLALFPPEQIEGLYGCLDYYQAVDDPFSRELLAKYDARFPGSALFTGGGASSGMYRALRLWEAAVREAGSTDRDDVIAALDHAKIAVGPGGPAEMVPGQHHPRMNMYIAQVRSGALEIVKGLGAIEPDEATVPALAQA